MIICLSIDSTRPSKLARSIVISPKLPGKLAPTASTCMSIINGYAISSEHRQLCEIIEGVCIIGHDDVV